MGLDFTYLSPLLPYLPLEVLVEDWEWITPTAFTTTIFEHSSCQAEQSTVMFEEVRVRIDT
jgi:hypothetical protein